MTTVEILKAARELISDKSKWTTDALSRDAANEPLESGFASGAVCWCALGAIEFITNHVVSFTSPVSHLYEAAEAIVGQFPAHINDAYGHATVMRMYNLAIALAEKGAA
jgi:hypothetical protein